MIIEKLVKISKFARQVTIQKLDPLQTISASHKIHNLHCFCKRQHTNNCCSKIRYLYGFNNMRYLHTKVETLPMPNEFTNEDFTAYKLLGSSETYANSVPKPLRFNEGLVVDNIEELLTKSWISMSNSEIIENFEHLSHTAFKYQEQIQDEKFHGVLEVLKARCIDFSDSDIRHLLKCLTLWKINKHEETFIELWKAFEAEFIKRFSSWTIDEILLTSHLYYRLKISRMSEFTFHSLKKIGKKPAQMNLAQLIHFTFLMKMNRRLPINVYNIEYYIEQNADKLCIQELAIMAMAFTQYETVVRSPDFIGKIIEKLIAEVDTVDQITLNAILQIIRLHPTTQERYINLLQTLENISSRFTLETLAAVAYSKKKTLIHNESFMSKILERCEAEIKDLTIRKIDKLLSALAAFAYDPKNTPFYSIAINELMDSSRADEIEKYPKLLICVVHSCLIMNYFPEELCKRIFDTKFVEKICGNNLYFLNREYLEISYCLELDHPEYSGPKLHEKMIGYLCQRFGSEVNKNIKRRSEKSSFDGMLLTQVEQISKKALKSDSAFYRDSVLPHSSKAFGIICYDPETKEFGSPKEKLSEIPWMMPKCAPADGRKWFALVTASVHQVINNTRKPIGKMLMQMKHLEKIGYETVFIPHYEWNSLTSDSEKEKYILDILHR